MHAEQERIDLPPRETAMAQLPGRTRHAGSLTPGCLRHPPPRGLSKKKNPPKPQKSPFKKLELAICTSPVSSRGRSPGKPRAPSWRRSCCRRQTGWTAGESVHRRPPSTPRPGCGERGVGRRCNRGDETTPRRARASGRDGEKLPELEVTRPRRDPSPKPAGSRRGRGRPEPPASPVARALRRPA